MYKFGRHFGILYVAHVCGNILYPHPESMDFKNNCCANCEKARMQHSSWYHTQSKKQICSLPLNGMSSIFTNVPQGISSSFPWVALSRICNSFRLTLLSCIFSRFQFGCRGLEFTSSRHSCGNGNILIPGGTPIRNRRGCSSESLNLTPKGDHLGVAQAFCDP